MLPGYLEGIKRAGGVPIILPLSVSEEQIIQVYEICQGFLFTGGHDVDPALYQEEKMACCGTVNRERDALERNIFEMAYRDDKPILGICRGIQLINVLLGGTLYQDLEIQFSKEIQHVMKPPYARSVHEVNLIPDTPLRKILGIEKLGVNSYHHQGIKKIADDLEIMAVATDGLIEAVYCKQKKFIWAVQWHPEFLYENSRSNMKIFEAFVNQCTP